MTSSRVYAEKKTALERMSSVYALGACLGVALTVVLSLIILGHSAKTLLTVSAINSAVVMPQSTEALDKRMPFRLPLIQHRLLSQIKTAESPVVPVYTKEVVAAVFKVETDIYPRKKEPVKKIPSQKNSAGSRKKKVHQDGSQAAKKKPQQSTIVTEKQQSAPHGLRTGPDSSGTALNDGQGITGQGTGSSGHGKDTYSLIATELHKAVERHKQYPRQARRIGNEGIATLRFSLDTSGKIIACSVTGSTGIPLLDKATKALGEKLVGTVIASAKGVGPVNISTPVRYALR